MRRILKWAGIAIAVLVVAGVLLAAFFDWNWLRNPISSMVSKVLDRRFAIHGDLSVDVSMTPRITMNQIELANTSWGSRPEMLNLDRIEFSIRLKNLLDRQVVLPEIRLSKPRLVLEKNTEGKTNWIFGTSEKVKQGKSTESPKIGLLTIDDGNLVYLDPKTEANLVVSTGVDTAKRQIIEVRGQGHFEKARLVVQVTAGSILSLREKLAPYPIDIEIAFGNTKVMAKGTLKDPVQFQGPDLMYTVQGSDLSEFYPVIGVSLPKTPPYKLSGHLTREGEQWILKNFQGFVGSSDLSGSIVYTTRNERPFLQADLASKKLDFKDLAGFLGAEPTPEKTESNRILPDKPYDLKALRTGDADVKFQSKNIITPNLPIDEFAAHLQLDHGKLRLDPLNFGIDIGQITSNIILNAQQDKIVTKADLEIHKVPFKRLLANTRFAAQSEGTFLGRANLAATGNSVAEMLGYADGDVAIIMENGRVSKLLVELIDLDIAKSFALALTKDPSIPIRCIIADFGVTQGLMRTQPLVMDTTESNIVGKGEINLRDETLDLHLTAHPKTASILNVQAPLIVKGPFKDPTVYPDPKYLAARTTASLALGALLTPVAAIIPWIELGLGKDSQCQTLIAAAKKNSAVAPRIRKNN
ncbi:MAG: AsmA family protein [Methylobacter sp.]|nr:AsmA family protein [Methylobacter sp.]